MEGHCSTGQSPQWAVVPMEEEDKQTRTENVFAFSSEISVGRSQFVDVLTVQPPADQNHWTFGCTASCWSEPLDVLTVQPPAGQNHWTFGCTASCWSEPLDVWLHSLLLVRTIGRSDCTASCWSEPLDVLTVQPPAGQNHWTF